jgi:hypothetical protein
MATEPIKRGDHIMGIPYLTLTSFDKYPWYSKFAKEGEELKMIARLIYERVYRFDMTDFTN